MTVLVEEATDTQAEPVIDDATPDGLARWHIRATALAVDLVPGVAVVMTMAPFAASMP